jgi:hypothetical protein
MVQYINTEMVLAIKRCRHSMLTMMKDAKMRDEEGLSVAIISVFY